MKLNPKLFIDVTYPVGSYYETSNTDFDPNNEWGGTWTREDDGTALVSYKSSGAFNKNIETIVGEETHQLTINEMPDHKHDINYASSAGGNGSGLVYGTSEGHNAGFIWATGDNQPHNNVQPSKVCIRWHRTA